MGKDGLNIEGVSEEKGTDRIQTAAEMKTRAFVFWKGIVFRECGRICLLEKFNGSLTDMAHLVFHTKSEHGSYHTERKRVFRVKVGTISDTVIKASQTGVSGGFDVPAAT